jgi:hypothetical protein
MVSCDLCIRRYFDNCDQCNIFKKYIPKLQRIFHNNLILEVYIQNEEDINKLIEDNFEDLTDKDRNEIFFIIKNSQKFGVLGLRPIGPYDHIFGNSYTLNKENNCIFYKGVPKWLKFLLPVIRFLVFK